MLLNTNWFQTVAIDRTFVNESSHFSSEKLYYFLPHNISLVVTLLNYCGWRQKALCSVRIKPCLHQQHVEFHMSKQHVECCRWTFCRFSNMLSDFFVLSTCRNELNMFNFFRHVERSNRLLSKKLVRTALSTCRTLIHSMSVHISVATYLLQLLRWKI